MSDQTLPLVISLEKFKPELTSSCLKTWFGSVEIYKQKVEYSSISDLCRTEIGHKTKKQEFQTQSLKKTQNTFLLPIQHLSSQMS